MRHPDETHPDDGHPDDATLNDVVDGLLSGEERRAVEAHLEACETCRGRADALRALTSDLAALPEGIPPGRDLRPGIRERARSDATGRRLRPALRAAAALLLAVGAGAAVWFGLLAPEPGAPRTGGSGVAAGDAIVAPYARATAELASALEARREALAPSVDRALDASLRSVERAIRELERARERRGPDAELARRLAAAYRTKLELLRAAAGLLPASAAGEET